jgi:acyl-CoA hydrolase
VAALIAIAHPAFREELAAQARALHLLQAASAAGLALARGWAAS